MSSLSPTDSDKTLSMQTTPPDSPKPHVCRTWQEQHDEWMAEERKRMFTPKATMVSSGVTICTEGVPTNAEETDKRSALAIQAAIEKQTKLGMWPPATSKQR